MTAETTVRPEATGDFAAIQALHRAAFGGEGEASLVDELREAGSVVLSLVAEQGDDIVGHVLYSRLRIDGKEARASALAPISIAPARQKQSIGSRLIEEAHRLLAAEGEQIVLVLGDPAYYRRFGFSTTAAKSFRTPYDGDYLMALVLSEDAPRSGIVEYPAPFARLG